MNEPLNQKKYNRLIAIIMLFFLAVIVALSFKYKESSAIESAFLQLEHNATYKANEIENWFFERKADARVFANRPVLAKELFSGVYNKEVKHRLTQRLIDVQTAYGYGLISVTNEKGLLLASSKPVASLQHHATELIQKSVLDQASYHSSFVLDAVGHAHLDFVAPIIHKENNQQISVGAVVFHMDPEQTIIKLLNEWPGNFETVFTGLFEPQKDGFIKRLNNRDSLSKISSEAMLQPHVRKQLKSIYSEISNGQTAGRKISFISHENEPVLLFYKVIQGTNWFMISRVNKQEVLAPVYLQTTLLALIGFLIITLVYLWSSQYWVRLKAKHNAEINTRLDNSRKHYLALFMDAPMPYQSLNDKGEILNVNHAWSELFGYSSEEVIGKHFSQFITPNSVPTMQENFPKFLESGSVQDVHFSIVTKSGEIKETILEGRISSHLNKNKTTHCTLIDVSEKAEHERQMRLAETVFTHLGEGVMVTDENCKIISVNHAFENILGYSEQDVIGKTPKLLQSGRHDDVFYQKMWQSIEDSGRWQGEIWNRKKGGELVPELLTISVLQDKKGGVDKYIGVFADITQIKDSQEELRYIANHDPLTSLPNRRNFLSAIQYAIQHAKREKSMFAIMMMDLDFFKNVNDSYGHSFGDEVLVEIGDRLKSQTREIDMLSRLGGDEFVFLLENLESSSIPARVAQSIIELVKQPISLSNGSRVNISASFGISLFPNHGNTPSELLQQADSALYHAKAEGRGVYEYYSTELTQKAKDRISIETELRQAIENRELTVYLQPQVNINSGVVESAEALVRWLHPEKGTLLPGQFIPVAEESNLIADVGEYVLYETCRQAKQWLDSGASEIKFAVNVSAKQVMHSDLYALVTKVLKETDLPPEMLELEITESGLVQMKEHEAVELFHKLSQLGLSIAIDDFGTGYSSLSYLQNLEFNVLKIDKSFVDAIPKDEKGMQIVNTVISMGKNLNLKVLAEGVERQEQLEFLKVQGCDSFQGFLKSRPVTIEDFATEFLTLN